ncbi:MAG: phosphoenolpyruvate--protein phosphotransferase [Neomegalonema sp.]|nr:phosphoenolpyruvate--protein phosphotransferase [Neomegalonema sp.]
MASSPDRGEGLQRARTLLRNVRAALAQPGHAQQRLDQIVHLIAQNMMAEVCSLYMMRDADTLELCATEGLNPAAVHATTLQVGQGLVGRIARDGTAINTNDAEKTPGFVYIPGIGEERFRSFLGTPLQRQGHTLGVLVVQNQSTRLYDEDEIDALELIATVIAEMTDAGVLEDLQSPRILTDPKMIRGTPAAEGVAIGKVVLHEPRIVIANPVAEDAGAERARLSEAMEALRDEVDRLIAHDAMDGGPGEHHDVLKAYRMFAHDRGWLRRLEAAIDSGLAAEVAVEKVQTETRARLQRTNDAYLRERLYDLDDLANRLLRQLLGMPPPGPDDLPENAILIARNLGPGDLIDYGRGPLLGVALEEGSAGSHAAIVARALRIPLVAGLKGLINDAQTDDAFIIDGDIGRIVLRPEPQVIGAYREKISLREQEEKRYAQIKDLPAITQDGVTIDLHMNAGLLSDLPGIPMSGATGVGLFRTELQYLISSRAPRRDAQAAFYSKVMDSAGGRPVVFRTLDMGGDKRLPFLKGEAEENPALGWRAIRIALDRPLLFRTQLQALLRASKGRPLSVMFPMIADPAEFYEARARLLAERDRLAARGLDMPEDLRIGAMLETPALAFAPQRFFELSDFVSVGGNDLMQFFFAADRSNERVRARYDALSPSFLSMLRKIVEQCDDAGTSLSFCGELCGRPIEAVALAGLGFRMLSMRPAAIGPVKEALRSSDLMRVNAILASALEEGRNPRAEITAYIVENLPHQAAQEMA